MVTELDRIIERYHRACESYLDAIAQARFDLYGSVSEVLLNDKARELIQKEAPEVINEIVDATIAYEQAQAGLRAREVEAMERNSALWTLSRERS